MKALTWFLLGASFLVQAEQAPQSYLKVEGAQLINTKGESVTLRGFGLGGWLMPEGYMLGLNKPNDSPQTIRLAISKLAGPETADEFFRRYEANYVTESDIKAIADWGFNSVRLPFNAERLMPRIKQPKQAPYVFDKSGFELVDNLVQWASKYQLYVILDMHAAPGGQSIHNIADSGGVARLWTEPETYWPQTIALWQELAKRYKSNPWVIGYDVLNEPMLPGTEELGKARMAEHDNSQLRQLYIELTKAFRQIDQGTKIMFLEGGFWGQNMKDLLPAWDKNTAYSYHAYPAPLSIDEFPDSVREVMDAGHAVWFGEWGENWNKLDRPEWLAFNRSVTALMEKNTVGWSWWTTKKLTGNTQAWQCVQPEGYPMIKAHLNKRGRKPSQDSARRTFLQAADNLATHKCHFNADLIESLGGIVN